MNKLVIALTILTGIYGLIYFLAKALGEATNVDWDEIEKTHDKTKRK